MNDSHITPGHVRAFQAVTSSLYDNITLWSCRINGEPGVAIVLVDERVRNTVAVMPLFVALTPGMKIEFEGGRESGDGDGGPTRSAAQEFTINKEVVTGPDPS
ncbi:MAG TPA: hypothetical protein VKW08_18215 [Xanthobacteraceae bacterium]|nr:hypothetical protein [Xanthobacteraceae bacterium]